MVRISNKMFYLLVSGILIVCILLALIVRFTIKEFQFERIVIDDYIYQPYHNIKYSNGIFMEVADSMNIMDESDYILKVRITGVRDVLQGAVRTEIEILDSLKGDFEKGIAYVYEPMAIDNYGVNKMVSTFGGYNFLKEKKDYILCVRYSPELETFMYITPMLGKFPESYEESEYLVLEDTEEKETLWNYKEYSMYEQVFESEKLRSQYFSNQKHLWEEYAN